MALKTLEGSLRFLFDTLLGVFGTDDATKAGGRRAPARTSSRWRPSSTRRTPAGRCCSAPTGVCVISHGSSTATAMMNAVLVAHECATRGLVDQVAAAVRPGETA